MKLCAGFADEDARKEDQLVTKAVRQSLQDDLDVNLRNDIKMRNGQRDHEKRINMTASPRHEASFSIVDESTGITTTGRWVNNALVVTRPNSKDISFDTVRDGQRLDFRDKTIKQVVTEVLELTTLLY